MNLLSAEQYLDSQRILIQRQGNLEEKTRLARIIAGIEDEKRGKHIYGTGNF